MADDAAFDPKGADVITGRSLLTFAPGMTDAKFEDLKQFLQRRVERRVLASMNRAPERWNRWPAYDVGLVPFPADELRDLDMARFGVRTIEDERWVRASVNPMAEQQDRDGTWGLEKTKVLQSKAIGDGVKVAILDSGIAMRHPAFDNRIKEENTKSFVDGVGVDDQVFGHGTHIAGIVCGSIPAKGKRYGIAHRAEILVGRVLNEQGGGLGADVLDGIEWAQSKRADVAVMAFGGSIMVGTKHDAWTQKVARKAFDNNLVLIAMAGNDSKGPQDVRPVNTPANCPSIMAVAAVDETLEPTDFSCGAKNPDGEVNIAAPGDYILSAWPPDTVRILRGTSQAAAFATGIAALWVQDLNRRGKNLWTTMESPKAIQSLKAPRYRVGEGLLLAPR